MSSHESWKAVSTATFDSIWSVAQESLNLLIYDWKKAYLKLNDPHKHIFLWYAKSMNELHQTRNNETSENLS